MEITCIHGHLICTSKENYEIQMVVESLYKRCEFPFLFFVYPEILNIISDVCLYSVYN